MNFIYSPLPGQQYVAKSLEDGTLHLQHHFWISLLLIDPELSGCQLLIEIKCLIEIL